MRETSTTHDRSARRRGRTLAGAVATALAVSLATAGTAGALATTFGDRGPDATPRIDVRPAGRGHDDHGRGEGRDHRDHRDHHGDDGCTAAPAAATPPVPSPAGAGVTQTVTLVVPPTVRVEQVERDGTLVVLTNAGRPPAAGDLVHLRQADGSYRPADAALTAAVLEARWRPGSSWCDTTAEQRSTGRGGHGGR